MPGREELDLFDPSAVAVALGAHALAEALAEANRLLALY